MCQPYIVLLHFLIIWVSEASPTLGCSIKISHDIMSICRYVCQFVYKKYVYQHAWIEIRGPNTRMLKV